VVAEVIGGPLAGLEEGRAAAAADPGDLPGAQPAGLDDAQAGGGEGAGEDVQEELVHLVEAAIVAPAVVDLAAVRPLPPQVGDLHLGGPELLRPDVVLGACSAADFPGGFLPLWCFF
jgi:hypothetical protein